MDDFKAVLYEQNSLSIDYDSVFKISDQLKDDVFDRAKNALARDGIETDIVLAYETDRINSSMTYGSGMTYEMACYTADGNYYEYEIDALNKTRVLDNDTTKFGVEQKVKETVLQENIELYDEAENTLSK